MDALDLLIADHNRFRGLFARFQAAHEAEDNSAMSGLADAIFEDLEVHTSLEEQVFYPAVHDLNDELAEEVDEGVEEHHVADVLMAEARELDPGGDKWVAKLTVLIESTEHHIDEEEEELFPNVRSASEASAREEWGARMEAMKAERGAPTPSQAAQLSIDELRRLASEQQIPGRSAMSKEELAAAVDARAEVGAPTR